MIETITTTVYKVKDRTFTDLDEAQRYEQMTDNPVDKTLKHDFKVGEKLYLCHWNRIIQVTVNSVNYAEDWEYDDELGHDVYARISNIQLVTLGGEELGLYMQSQVDGLKRDWRELLDFEIE